jgi:hypothetical protein
VRALYIALGYKTFNGISLDLLDGSMSIEDAYEASDAESPYALDASEYFRDAAYKRAASEAESSSTD